MQNHRTEAEAVYAAALDAVRTGEPQDVRRVGGETGDTYSVSRGQAAGELLGVAHPGGLYDPERPGAPVRIPAAPVREPFRSIGPISSGPISSGTTRAVDTIPAMLDALDDLDPLAALIIREDLGLDTVETVLDWGALAEDEERSDVLGAAADALFDALDGCAHCAPYGIMFGFHRAREGAALGFWVDWEGLDTDEYHGSLRRIGDLSDLDDPDDLDPEVDHVLLEDDDGTATLYRVERGTTDRYRLVELWSVD